MFYIEYEIDCEETFALVARISSIPALLAITPTSKWDHFRMDIKNVSLMGI